MTKRRIALHPRRSPRPWTRDDTVLATAMLKDGHTYADVGRRLNRSIAVIMRNVPGYPTFRGGRR